MELTVLTWNIWGGRNRNAVIQFLQQNTWDIIALQEVTQREINGDEINDAEELAKALACEYYYERSFRTDRHTPVYDLGNALLSRHPIKDRNVYTLSDMSSYKKNSTTEPRNAVEITISVNQKDLHILSTHIGYDDLLGEGELQKKQIEELLQHVPKKNTILMGDFNSTPNSSIVKRVTDHFVHSDTDLSANSWTNLKKTDNPQYRIDYIFTTPDITTHEFHLGKSDASDHLPLIAQVNI